MTRRFGLSLIVLGLILIALRSAPQSVAQPAAYAPVPTFTPTPPPSILATPFTPPRILQRQQNTSVLYDRRPLWWLVFDRSMDQASVEAALQVEPPLPFKLTWANQTLYVATQNALMPGAHYTFTLRSSARDQAGLALSEDYTWHYELPPTIHNFTGPSDWQRDDPVTLTFSYPMDTASVTATLALSPTVAGAWHWNREQTILTLMPAEPLVAETTYRLSFARGLTDAAGDPLPTPAPREFTTPAAIIHKWPEAGEFVDPQQPLRITFDRAMDQASVAAALRMEPPISGTVTWDGRVFHFMPTRGYWQEDTSYTATLAPTALDSTGRPILRQPVTWAFNTHRLSRPATFGDGAATVQLVDAAGRRALHFQLFGQQGGENRPTGTIPISFTLYALDQVKFQSLYQQAQPAANQWRKQAIPTAGLPITQQWVTSVPTGIAEESVWVREVQIPAAVAPGLYLLQMGAPPFDDQLLVVLTRHGLLIKQAPGQWLTWLTAINGAHVADAEISLYDTSGNLIEQARTDELGQARFTLSPETQPTLAFARVGDDLTLAGVDGQWRTHGGPWWWGWQPETPAHTNAAYIYTDRPIYRPGQTVHFKAMLRSDDDASLSLPPLNTPITVTLRDARNNAVQSQVLTTNDFGTLHGDFHLAEGAMLGEYAIELLLDGDRHRQIFKVEEYRKPDYAVTVTPSAEHYVVGETISVQVDSRYFYDAPTPNASVIVKRYQLLPRGWWGQAERPEEYSWLDMGELELRGQTDANGRFTFTLPAPEGDNSYSYDWQSSLRRHRWGLEVTVDDGSHQTVSGFAVVTVFSASEKVWLEPGAYVQEAGQPFTLRAHAATMDDVGVADRRLSLTVQRPSWQQNSPVYHGTQTSTVQTDGQGLATFPLTLTTPGYYEAELTALDAQGKIMSFKQWFFVTGPGESWADFSSGDRLRIHADRESYAPGDSARLLIETELAGPALLTFERGRTRRSQLIQLTPPLTTVDVAIQEDDAPNIFVAVNAWEAQSTEIEQHQWASKADSRLVTASVNLRVPPNHKRLTVTLTPEQSHYAPRSTATFTVSVRNADDQPVAAEIALALVDEAIFSLSEELAGPIFKAFYYERPNQVQTFDSMAPLRWFSGGGGGGGGGIAANPRSNFPDTALWLPVVRTDGAGQAVVTVTLPDNLTQWRLTAKVLTAQQTQVGEAFVNIVTQQPLIVRPLLPRLLTAGDQAELAALVQNETNQPRTVTVTLQLSPTSLLAAQGELTQTLDLAPHATGIVGWPVQARQAGDAAITVVARGAGDLADAVRLPLPIRALAIPDSQSQVGEFRGDFSTPITLPGFSLASSSVTVEVNRSIAGSLFNGLEYLTGYPYGCVEQTMSRALPNAVVGRALRQLGLPNQALQAQLPALLDAGRQQLYGFQHNDGGWGWWYDDASDAYQTAWVLFGLSVTQEAGYPVEPAVLKRGAEWLRGKLASMDRRTRAYALYSMAVAGYGDLPATRELLAQADQLDAFSQAALALTLHSLGLEEEAGKLVDQLAAVAMVRDDQASWPNAQSDGYYRAKSMASTTRTTALVLSALTRIRPTHPLIAQSVRWLMSHRQGMGWGTTNETAYAILGLTDHLLALSEAHATTSYRIEWNGTLLGRGVLDREHPRFQWKIPADKLQSGTNHLRLVAEDGGQIYYVITQRSEVGQRQIAAAGKVQVKRTYLAQASGQPLTRTIAGQLVQVRLRVTVPETAFYLIVEDKLPGGLEALNERLNTTSHVADPYGNEPQSFWQEYGYNHKEVRDGRVSFFVTELAAGMRQFTYLARATHAGEFTALPAEAYAMYDPTTWGRSASTTLLIEPKPAAYNPQLDRSVIWYMTNRNANGTVTNEWRAKTWPYTARFEQPALEAVQANLQPYFTGEGAYLFDAPLPFSPNGRYALATQTESDLGERQPHWVLTLIDLESGATRQLVDKSHQFLWHPNGEQIAYTYDHTLYTVRLDVPSEPMAIFSHPELNQGFLQWSPDGRWLATTTMHTGIPDATNNYPYTQTVWLVSTVDHMSRPLVTLPAVGRGRVMQEMSWSFDSQYLVFQGEILGLDGSRVTLNDAGAVNLWLPNRQQLLVTGSSQGLRIVDLAGQTQRQVSDQPIHFWEQAFAHDGARLAYTKHHPAQEQTDLWIFDLVTGQNQQITTLPTSCIRRLRWSRGDDALLVGGCSAESPIWSVTAQPDQTLNVLVEHGFLLEVVPWP